MHQQINLFTAQPLPAPERQPETPRDKGRRLAKACAKKAGAEFYSRARAFVLAHLATHPGASGEAITDACKAAGIVPSDDRAFGAVYGALLRQGHIRVVRIVARQKGHGCLGAKVYTLTDGGAQA